MAKCPHCGRCPGCGHPKPSPWIYPQPYQPWTSPFPYPYTNPYIPYSGTPTSPYPNWLVNTNVC